MALVIRGDRFVYVGSNGEARKYIGPRTVVMDLKGKTVLPGLIDAHLHLQGIGEAKMRLDAFWKPKKEILDAVATAYGGPNQGMD